jgi:hypothetical protein
MGNSACSVSNFQKEPSPVGRNERRGILTGPSAGWPSFETIGKKLQPWISSPSQRLRSACSTASSSSATIVDESSTSTSPSIRRAADDGFGRDDDEVLFPRRPDPSSDYPEKLIDEAETRARMSTFQDSELLARARDSLKQDSCGYRRGESGLGSREKAGRTWHGVIPDQRLEVLL